MDYFVDYGQWIVLAVSILAIALLASTEAELRQRGYIFTAIARFGGGIIFIITGLWALAITNAIYVVLSMKGYVDNRSDTHSKNPVWEYICKAMGTKAYDENEKADRVAVIRLFWVVLHIVTCCAIIAGNGRVLGVW